ncbi:hypothetical protein ACFFMN_02570 [Planobispora siamensis]|uniref:Uncharacterized protein n=1 Tax=Planobispora siamensis TaxID=936338 RepID=A0A8J3SIW8_9ACTN|nr:hypothetical protein [Planobispora siamensis]GIH93039.1 hypothetical protein Psi01_36690 [Planobispora siamensis]
MPAVTRGVPVAVLGDDVTSSRDDRTARFATGVRRVVRRAFAIGGMVAAGWLLAVVFGLFGTAPAVADTTAATGAALSDVLAVTPFEPAVQAGGFPTESGELSAGNAEAMAGRGVDGLTRQSAPGSPAPSTVDPSAGSNGFVPQTGGGSGLSGPSVGDVARFVYDPQLRAHRVPRALVLPPVVRTAADDPSISPD